jgi:hypothetical protein
MCTQEVQDTATIIAQLCATLVLHAVTVCIVHSDSRSTTSRYANYRVELLLLTSMCTASSHAGSAFLLSTSVLR